jgi:hypothetical protein
VTIDHARAIRDARYFAKKRVKLEAAARRQGLIELHAIHDDNGNCCRRETWKATLARLIGAAVGNATNRTPANVESVLAEHEPDVIVASEDHAS